MDVLGRNSRDRIGARPASNVGLLLFSLVSLIMLLSSLYAAEASVFRKARETAIEVAAPVLNLISAPLAWVNDRVGDVSDYFRVLEQNNALRQENAALRQWEGEARSLRALVASLEELGAYKAPPEAKPINAFVIGEANEAYAHSMVVNAGVKDGVMRGLAAVDGQGLIGRIVDVSNDASRILLLNDIQSRIPVFVEGSYVEGLLVGRSSTKPAISISMLADIDRVKPGQRVVTSGAGGVLPRGIDVGVIATVTEKEALVDLSADYARTRMVRIINYRFPEVAPNELPNESQPVETSAVSVETTLPQTTSNAPDNSPAQPQPIDDSDDAEE
ncbi:MAG: rod shape-determining protein MreC [Parvularculaceae bacterium]